MFAWLVKLANPTKPRRPAAASGERSISCRRALDTFRAAAAVTGRSPLALSVAATIKLYQLTAAPTTDHSLLSRGGGVGTDRTVHHTTTNLARRPVINLRRSVGGAGVASLVHCTDVITPSARVITGLAAPRGLAPSG